MTRYSRIISLAILLLVFFCPLPSIAQMQTLNLKTGFNFISFTLNPSSTPAGFIQSCGVACEDIYLYSASAGGFLSASEGTLTSLAAGKGYIFKMKSDFAASVAGTPVSTLGPINLKAGFNLVGFSKAPSSEAFSVLMKKFPFISGIYKWNPASGSFMQVIKNGETPLLLDGVDPSVAAGQSYFINLVSDTALDLDGLAVSFGGGAAAVTPGTAKSIDLGGGVKIDMVFIPAGTFVMGSPTDVNDVDEVPQRTLRITRGFYMAKFETTQAQWQAVMGNNPSFFTGDLSRPVEQVSWNDICNKGGFLDKLNRKGAGIFRLPTEAEWEYACRAGSTTAFYWGETFSGDYCWYSSFFDGDGNSGHSTHPVGQKKPNAFGLYDMGGNVLEWCSDWYARYPSGNFDDPLGASSGDCRVIRGGSAIHNPADCRSAFRYDELYPNNSFKDCGFRLVMSPDTPTYYLNKTSDSIVAGGTYNLAGLSLIATFPNGISQTLTPAWTVIFGGGSISGEVNFVAPALPGASILRASYAESGVAKTANFTINITTSITSVTISGGTAVAAGKTLQLSAMAVDANGGVVTGRTPVWTSLNLLAATVDSSGLVTGVAAGSTVIRATIDGRAQEVTISVTAPSFLPAKFIELGGGVNLEMVYIPAGTFVMGTPENEPDRAVTGMQAEGPQHAVNITRGFYMGRFELTQAQWKAIMGSREFSPAGDNFPANNVKWNEINDDGGFLDTLNRKSIGSFNLPTEAQWEYACRAGTKTAYYWGDTMNGDYCLYSANFKDYYPVGTKLPNAWGLYDMSGSAMEWCYDALAPYDPAIVNDPIGLDQTQYFSAHVLRGGCSESDVSSCRSGARNYYSSGALGFRLIMAEPNTEKTLIAMKLSNGTDSVFVNQTYDLSKISANLQYSGETLGTPHAVTPQWSVKSGGGNLSGQSFTAPAVPGTTILTASFSEGGKTVSADFIIITENAIITATIDAAGGTVAGEGLSYSIPSGAFTAPKQVMISKTTPPAGINVPLVGDCYKISAVPTKFSGELSFTIDVKDPAQFKNDTYMLMSVKNNNGQNLSTMIKGNLENNKLKFSMNSPNQATPGPNSPISRATDISLEVHEANIAVSPGWRTEITGNDIFTLTYHSSIESFNGHTAIIQAINEAYDKMSGEVGLDWSRTGEKIEVLIFDPGNFAANPGLFGVVVDTFDIDSLASFSAAFFSIPQYGRYYICLNPNRLNNQNDVPSMRATVAHEMFHSLTSYYYGAEAASWNWFDEASATWFERVVTHQAGYIPPSLTAAVGGSDNWMFLKTHGLENGDPASSRDFGYGASMFLSFITSNANIGNKIIGQILKQRALNNSAILPCDAIKKALSSLDYATLSTLWLDFCKNYLLGKIYNDVTFPDWEKTPQLASISIFKNCNDSPKIFNCIVQDLSAKFYILKVDALEAGAKPWPDDAVVRVNFTFNKAEAQNISLQAFNISRNNRNITYISEMNNEVEKTFKVSDLIGRANMILFMIVNKTAVTPYNGSIPVTCNMNVNLNKIIDLGGGVKLEMVRIPAGTFIMGPANATTNEVRHQVTLSKGFYMGKYEMTIAQWRAIMGPNGLKWYPDTDPADFPAYDLYWNDICNPGGFLETLNAKGLGKFRLPTEAEWEYACRGGTATDRYWGSSAVGDYCWYSGNANTGATTSYRVHSVGKKLPNSFGLYDMNGNVDEWCSDWYGAYSSAAVTDPTGPSASTNDGRVVRGGGWSSDATDCSSTYRKFGFPTDSFQYRGFRVVMEE